MKLCFCSTIYFCSLSWLTVILIRNVILQNTDTFGVVNHAPTILKEGDIIAGNFYKLIMSFQIFTTLAFMAYFSMCSIHCGLCHHCSLVCFLLLKLLGLWVHLFTKQMSKLVLNCQVESTCELIIHTHTHTHKPILYNKLLLLEVWFRHFCDLELLHILILHIYPLLSITKIILLLVWFKLIDLELIQRLLRGH
jgi:hypothetical protein